MTTPDTKPGDNCPHCNRRFTVAMATNTETKEIDFLIYCMPCHVSRSNDAPFTYTHHINAAKAA